MYEYITKHWGQTSLILNSQMQQKFSNDFVREVHAGLTSTTATIKETWTNKMRQIYPVNHSHAQ